MAQKTIHSHFGHFSYVWAIFPLFPGEAKIHWKGLGPCSFRFWASIPKSIFSQVGKLATLRLQGLRWGCWQVDNSAGICEHRFWTPSTCDSLAPSCNIGWSRESAETLGEENPRKREDAQNNIFSQKWTISWIILWILPWGLSMSSGDQNAPRTTHQSSPDKAQFSKFVPSAPRSATSAVFSWYGFGPKTLKINILAGCVLAWCWTHIETTILTSPISGKIRADGFSPIPLRGHKAFSRRAFRGCCGKGFVWNPFW